MFVRQEVELHLRAVSYMGHLFRSLYTKVEIGACRINDDSEDPHTHRLNTRPKAEIKQRWLSLIMRLKLFDFGYKPSIYYLVFMRIFTAGMRSFSSRKLLTCFIYLQVNFHKSTFSIWKYA